MANNFDPFVPEWWAKASLAILNENLVAARLFNSDFTDQFQNGGDTVNTRRPQRMTADRKAKTSPIVPQDVGADNIPVVLNQHVYNAFTVHDLDKQFTGQDLVNIYIRPAVFAMASFADRVVSGQAARLLVAGYVSGDPSQRVFDSLVDARLALDNQLAPDAPRNCLMNPNLEAKLLKDKDLVTVDKVGTTRTLRQGWMGELVGIDMYKTTNLPQSDSPTGATGTQTLTLTADALRGATTILSNQSTVALAVGDWVKVGGVPYKITNIAAGTPATFTLSRPLHKDIVTGTKVYGNKGISFNANYPAGHTEAIVLAPGANQYVPRNGDFVEIKGKGYAVVKIDAGNKYTLDRPLDDAVTAGVDLVQAIPSGNYSLVAHPDMLTVALRPLAPTRSGIGVLSSYANFGGMTMRATMGYNQTTQNTQVTLDFLMGVSFLEYNYGTVLCA